MEFLVSGGQHEEFYSCSACCRGLHFPGGWDIYSHDTAQKEHSWFSLKIK